MMAHGPGAQRAYSAAVARLTVSTWRSEVAMRAMSVSPGLMSRASSNALSAASLSPI